MALADRGDAAPVACRAGRRRAAHDQRPAVRKRQRLGEAEDRDVAERAEWAIADRGHPCGGAVLDQKQLALVAPRPPVGGGLRKAQIVDQEQSPRFRAHQGFELSLVGRQRGAGVVEPAYEPRVDQRLHLRPAVVGWH